MRDTRVKYKNHSGNTSIHFDSVLVTRADFEHDIIPYFLEWKPRFLFLFSKSTDSILARLLFTVFFLKISVSVVYNSMCQWSKWQKRVRKCYDFNSTKVQKRAAIKKQLGNIQSMKLRLLFTIFSSKLRLLFEGGFYSTKYDI